MAPTSSLIEKMQKILALTDSPHEGEAQTAATMLQRLLTEHNLSMADLEKRGGSRPDIMELGHDLGKAAFNWKLDLATVIADHYFCFPVVNHHRKTVVFVGRPDNVESLDMLYGWLMEQIKRIAREERRKESMHIDPLRWQVNFGAGAVSRLRERLQELREAQAANVTETGLVVSHQSEISDFFEDKYGYREDGKQTKQARERHEAWAEAATEAREQKETDREEMDDEAFFAKYPEEDPEVRAAKEARWAKEDEKDEKRRERNAQRRRGRYQRPISDEELTKIDQQHDATIAGFSAADQVNLTPFIEGDDPSKEKLPT